VRDAIIDGQAAVLRDTGLPDFQALRRELGNPASPRLLYHAFDLLYLNGVCASRSPKPRAAGRDLADRLSIGIGTGPLIGVQKGPL
jgi:hypothetical protein